MDDDGWYSETYMDEKSVFAFVEEVIKEDPILAAKKLNNPEIARLKFLPALLKKLRLSEILADFCEHIQFKRDKHDKADICRAWSEFAKYCGPSLQDVNPVSVSKHNQWLQSKSFAERTIKNRINYLYHVLNFAKAMHKDYAQFIGEAKVDIGNMVKKPSQSESYQNFLFHKLLKAADVRWQSMHLPGLNSALHPDELAELTWNEIDLDDKSLIDNRSKTGELRVCRLWGRTV